MQPVPSCLLGGNIFIVHIFSKNSMGGVQKYTFKTLEFRFSLDLAFLSHLAIGSHIVI